MPRTPISSVETNKFRVVKCNRRILRKEDWSLPIEDASFGAIVQPLQLPA